MHCTWLMSDSFAQNSNPAPGFDAFKTARPENAASRRSVFVNATHAPAQAIIFQVNAMPAFKANKLAAIRLHQTFGWNIAKFITRLQRQIVRIPAETAGAAGHTVKRRFRHINAHALHRPVMPVISVGGGADYAIVRCLASGMLQRPRKA